MAAERYRPEIDGLRAIAVLSVVCFHLGASNVRGGYVGVDVFFVISGFLITRLIKDQTAAGTFRFGDFYLRRARRLLPMLVVTLAATSIAAGVLLSPQLLKDFGESAVAASVSMSNILFYKKVGYFDTGAILKPLLHTWSLSVEEQFYIFWPATLVACLRRLPRATPVVIAVGGLASLALSLRFGAATAATFYLTPFRVWEFAVGALLVWLPERARGRTDRLAEAGCALGLLLVALAVLMPARRDLDQWHLLLACAGAALAISFGAARYAGLVLRNRASVFLGRISYSVYLVHWPLIVFFSYNRREDLTAIQRLALLAATLLIAALSWRYIETPLRRAAGPKPWVGVRPFVAGCAAGVGLIVGLGTQVWATDGWLWRFPAAIRQQIRPEAIKADRDYTWKRFRSFEHPWPGGAARRVLVVGDSQAADFFNILAEAGRLPLAAERTIEVDNQCQALISLSPTEFEALSLADRKACAASFRDLQRASDLSGVDEVILGFNWDDRGIPFIARAATALRQRGARRVFVVGRKSQGLGGPEALLQDGLGPNLEAYSAASKNPIAWRANAEIEAIHGDFRFIDLMSRICPVPTSCRVLTNDRNIIFFDGSHLSPSGARYLGALLAQAGALPF